MSRASDVINFIDPTRCISILDDSPPGRYEMAVEPAEPDGYTRLACAVLAQSIADLAKECWGYKLTRASAWKAYAPRRLDGEEAARAEALGIELLDCPTFGFWAWAVELSPAVLVQGALKRIVAGQALRVDLVDYAEGEVA
jgi:hypothetical protein